MDYFTKWAKVEALANIRDVDVKKFVWRNIVTRFGVPKSFVFNNGLQFDSRTFREFCSNLDIKNKYSTSAYPQSNSQVEATNKAIVNGLKKRLEGTKGRWTDELPNVLCKHGKTGQTCLTQPVWPATQLTRLKMTCDPIDLIRTRPDPLILPRLWQRWVDWDWGVIFIKYLLILLYLICYVLHYSLSFFTCQFHFLFLL